jgi:hypothetical protein
MVLLVQPVSFRGLNYVLSKNMLMLSSALPLGVEFWR